jgi:hypothetical protein
MSLLVNIHCAQHRLAAGTAGRPTLGAMGAGWLLRMAQVTSRSQLTFHRHKSRPTLGAMGAGWPHMEMRMNSTAMLTGAFPTGTAAAASIPSAASSGPSPAAATAPAAVAGPILGAGVTCSTASNARERMLLRPAVVLVVSKFGRALIFRCIPVVHCWASAGKMPSSWYPGPLPGKRPNSRVERWPLAPCTKRTRSSPAAVADVGSTQWDNVVDGVVNRAALAVCSHDDMMTYGSIHGIPG